MSVDSEKLKIFNMALRQAQAPRIARLDETSASALACADLYGNMFYQTLIEFEWNWGGKRAALTAHATDPIGDGWEARYALPADFLRIHKIDTDGINEYVIEGGYLLCNNDDGITLVYWPTDTAITAASVIFKRLLEKRMAAALASDLSHDRILSRTLEQESMQLVLLAYRECTDWSREDEPLTLRPPGYASGRLPHYGNI